MRYLHLSGLTRPAIFEDAAALEALVPAVLPGWPLTWTETPPAHPPFAVLKPGEDRAWSIALDGRDPREWDAVDALCDLVAELAWERLRERPALLSLHAAALRFGDRLVVFPDVRRAGKSTLTAALARLGHAVFADDVLPVDIDGGADRPAISGLGCGAAPRLRLPLPDSFSPDFHDWVATDPGPGNGRYKYLARARGAGVGDACAIGAIVVLDRQDDAGAPRLLPIERGDALERMIRQNFSRDQHSARILGAADRLTRELPVFRLSYACAEAAARFLHDHPALRDLPTVVPGAAETAATWTAAPARAFADGATYARAPDLFETEADGEIYLSDQSGAAIHRLNAGSVMIWRALSDPSTPDEVAELLATAFPDVDVKRIAADTRRTLRQLSDAGLIAPLPEVLPA